MEKISPGQIHLADQRGCTKTQTLRRYSSFNYGSYFSEYRKPFGRLEVLNDEMLAGGKSTVVIIENSCWFVLMPVTGEVLLKSSNGTRLIDVGEVFAGYVIAGEKLELINLYKSDWINYIYLQLRNDEIINVLPDQVFKFDFTGRQNELIDLIPDSGKHPFRLHIGLLGGRTDLLYPLQNNNSLFYAFVLAGAFELQGRLMHERDGLALWQLEEADLEALSNNAVIVILEMLN